MVNRLYGCIVIGRSVTSVQSYRGEPQRPAIKVRIASSLQLCFAAIYYSVSNFALAMLDGFNIDWARRYCSAPRAVLSFITFDLFQSLSTYIPILIEIVIAFFFSYDQSHLQMTFRWHYVANIAIRQRRPCAKELQHHNASIL